MELRQHDASFLLRVSPLIDALVELLFAGDVVESLDQ